MSESILSANPLLSQSDANTHRAQLFQALMGTSDAVPLDSTGTFSIIRSNRYQQLLTTLAQSQSIKEKLDQQFHLLTLSNIEIKKELQLTKQKLSIYNQNSSALESQLDSVSQQLKNREQLIVELEERLKKAELKNSIQQSQAISLHQPPKTTVTHQTSAQTNWEQPEPAPTIVNEAEQLVPEPDDAATMQQKLYQILRANAETFEAEFKERLKRLEECQVTLQNWEKEKVELRQQNQRLRQEARVRSVEDQKIRIWQESVSELMQNVQKSISAPDSEGLHRSESREQWEDEAMERGRLAELRLRIKQAEEKMRDEDEGLKEGPVVTLVRLSQEIKAIVRGMLVQSEYA